MPRNTDFLARTAAPRRRAEQFAMPVPHERLAEISSASAHRVDDAPPDVEGSPDLAWQIEAFKFNEAIGEVGYLHNLTANSIADCQFRVTRNEVKGGQIRAKESDDPRAVRVMAALTGPQGGSKELKRRAALHYQVAGESLLLGTPLTSSAGLSVEGYSWEFCSTEELRFERKGGKRKAYRTSTGPVKGVGSSSLGEPVHSEAFIARLWRPNPRFSKLADSPMKRVLKLCRELVMLTDAVEGVTRSRLSAGMAFIPEELSFETVEEDGDTEHPEGDDDRFIETLIEHMSAPLRDHTSAASFVPLVLRGPADMADKIKLISLSGEFDEAYAALRVELLDRIAHGLDAPPEILTGKAKANHWCMPDAVRAYTRSGWANLDDLSLGTEILTLNTETGLAEFAPVEDRYEAEVEDQEMIRIENRHHVSISTPEHRWFVRRDGEDVWTTSAELKPEDRLILSAPSPGLPTVAKWEDAFVELVAWYMCDGTAIGSTPQVRIGKSHRRNPERVSELRRIFTDLFGPAITKGTTAGSSPKWREAVEDDRGMTLFCPNKAASSLLLSVVPGRDKVVPLSFIESLTLGQLHLFLNTCFKADGDRNGERRSIGQKDPRRLDAVEHAGIRAGFSTRRWVTRSGGFGRFDFHHLSLRRALSGPVGETQSVSYSGRIWCPVTRNSTWLAQSEGRSFFTGNSAYAIDADFVSKHINPVGNALASFLTVAYLRPMLIQYEGMSPQEALGFQLVFDSRTLSASTDQGPAATNAWDRLALSDESYLNANGFDSENMPSEEERQRRLLEKLLLADPNYAPVIMPILHPELAEDFAGVVPSGDATPALPEGEPPSAPGAEPEQSSVNDLIAKLQDRASQGYEAVLSKAAFEVRSKIGKGDHGLRRKLLSGPATEVLSTMTRSDYRRVGQTREALLSGQFGEVEAEAQVEVEGWLVGHGAPVETARPVAAAVASAITDAVETWAIADPSGGRVPEAAIAEPLMSVLSEVQRRPVLTSGPA